MQSRQTVTAEYIQGIKDGRQWCKQFNPDMQMLRDNIRNIKMTMREFSAGPVKDCLRGELHMIENAMKSKLTGIK